MRHVAVGSLEISRSGLGGALFALLLLAFGSRVDGGPQSSSVETRSPNGVGQVPASSGQTRVEEQRLGVSFQLVTVAEGLVNPWGLQFLPDGRMLVTEKPGRLRYVTAAGQLSEPISGVPSVVANGESGLLDVALDPAFDRNRRLYVSYMEPREGAYNLAVARGELNGNALASIVVIFRADPVPRGSSNVGGRIVFDRDGNVFVSVGDRLRPSGRAQDLEVYSGKIIRITADGGVRPDNPFVGRPGAKPEIWSYGHRNPQGLVLNPATGALWNVEHGARGGDEINTPERAKNYGWPVVTYGIDYSGRPIGAGITVQAGMEQPLYYWDPVIAPSGLLFYTGDTFPSWRGSLFVGGLTARALVRLSVNGRRITGEEHLLRDQNERIRDVRQGPDGLIYVVTDNPQGRILKLAPRVP